MSRQATETSVDRWPEANRRFVETELHRLRLLLHRRVLWLRRQWKQDPLQNYQGLVISDAQADSLLAGEDRGAEAEFYAKDPGAIAIGRSIAAIEHDLQDQMPAFMVEGRPPAIEGLVRLFGLSRFERAVLLLCLAPEIDPAFERLYAYVQDDATRKYATPQLALALLVGAQESWLDAKESLMAIGQLRRFVLIAIEPAQAQGSAASAALRITERVADYILGTNRLDEQAVEMLAPMPPALVAGPHLEKVDQLFGWIEKQGKQGPWPAVNLVGPAGSGKRAVARALADRIGLQVYALNVSKLTALGTDRSATFRLLEREAVLSQFAVYLDCAAIDDGPQSALKIAAEEAVERLSVFLIAASAERWPSQRKMITARLSKPDSATQRQMWEQALSGVRHSLNGHIDALAHQFDFGPTGIVQVVSRAGDRISLDGPEAELIPSDLWEACRDQAGWQLNQLAQPVIPCHTWEDIILPDDSYRQLQEIADQVGNRALVYEQWGFGAKLNRGRGISALFSGASGTGKTLAAEILANHLNLSLYRIDLSGVVSKYIGETEKNLRRVFDAAEKTGAILFFDEADALFGKRSEVKDSHDRYANIEINYLLQRMEDYRGLAILATNMKSHLDQAFMRRLRFLVDFPFPDAAHRAEIWQRVFPKGAQIEGLEYSRLSRMEIAGGNIKNIAVNAAFLAAGEGRAIRMGHIFQAARREYAKIDKLMLESEFGRYYEAATK